jgi:hypothetical protein
MAKRFTDTEKWKDEWFLELEPLMKMLWLYMLDTCDHAGVWKVNFKLASYSIGTALDRQSAINALGSRINIVALDKWHVPKFITYQQKGFLNPGNNAHKGILNLLNYHNIQTSPYLLNANTSEGLVSKSLDSLGAQVKVKVKVKDSPSSFSSLNPKSNNHANKIKPDFLIQKWNDEVNGVEKLSYCHGLSGQDLGEFATTTSFENFQKVESWENVFSNIKQSEFLNGKKGSFVATLNWSVKHDNALKVLNGQYSGTPDDQKQGKAAFKSKTNGIAPTPQNPTGNPYIQEAIKKGYIA